MNANGDYTLMLCGNRKCNLVNPPEESEFRISLEHLREILEDMADGNGFLVEDVDDIIKRVKYDSRRI